MNLCDYGCNQEGKFQLKNGKYCCSDHYNKCPEIRRKNSLGVKKAHKENPNMNLHVKGSNKMNGWDKGGINNTGDKYKTDICEIFKENSNYKNEYIKKRIINDNLIPFYNCSICGINDWLDKILVLELDHINGIHNDNRIENLRFLCPNCHSQTDTFRGRNVNTGKTLVSDEEVIETIKTSKTVLEVLTKLNLSSGGGNYGRIYKIMMENNLTFTNII